MVRTLLVIPPDYDCNYPPLGTPALQAFLKKHGIPCEQIDLNLAYRDFLVSRVSGPPPFGRAEALFFLKPLLNGFFTRPRAGTYYASCLPAGDDGIFPHLPYDNNTNSSFYFAERILSSEHLGRYLEDAVENTFLQSYEEARVAGTVEKGGFGLVGISITSPSQAIAALTLGRYLKARRPGVHVSIGGQWPTLYRRAIMDRQDLFRCFDSVIVFEGETALAELCRRLAAKRDIAGIPNIIVPGTTDDPAAGRREEEMDDLPCPDFDGLPLDAYDGGRDGELCLTYETSRGCYWSRCAYCVDLPLPKPSYRRKNPARAAADMATLARRYGAGYLLFGDPGLSPRQMGELSRRLVADGTQISWWTMARLDPGFAPELFANAAKAGLRQVNFGFESASDRVCDLLEKGNRRERSSRIIRDCAAAGVTVDLQTIVGLPGERYEDALETVDFLVAHRDAISHVTFNTYYLTPGCPIHRDPGRYGIEYADDPALPFRFFLPFRNTRGMAMAEADTFERLYYTLAGRAQGAVGIEPPSRPGAARLSLLGRTCELRYRSDPATETYSFDTAAA